MIEVPDEISAWDNGMGAPGVDDWSESPESQPRRKEELETEDQPDSAYQIHRRLLDDGYRHIANAMTENEDGTHSFGNWYEGPEGMIEVAHAEHPNNFCAAKDTRAFACKPHKGALALDASLTGGAWKTIDGTHVYIKGGQVVAGPAHLMGRKHSGGDEQNDDPRVKAGPGSSKDEALEEDFHHPKMNIQHDAAKLKAMKKDSRGLFRGKLNNKEADAVKKFSYGYDSDIRSREMGTNQIKRPEIYRNGLTPEKLHETFKSAYEKLPDYNGTVYRGMKLTPEQAEHLRSSKSMELPAVSSFSRKAAVAHDFATKVKNTDGAKTEGVVLKMTGKSKEMSHLSNFGEKEAETLHKKGTKFQITKTYYAKSPRTGAKLLVVEGHQA